MPSPTNKSCPVSKTYSNRTFRHSFKQRYHTARFKLIIIVKSLIVAWEQANLCKFEEAELPAWVSKAGKKNGAGKCELVCGPLIIEFRPFWGVKILSNRSKATFTSTFWAVICIVEFVRTHPNLVFLWHWGRNFSSYHGRLKISRPY